MTTITETLLSYEKLCRSHGKEPNGLFKGVIEYMMTNEFQ